MTAPRTPSPGKNPHSHPAPKGGEPAGRAPSTGYSPPENGGSKTGRITQAEMQAPMNKPKRENMGAGSKTPHAYFPEIPDAMIEAVAAQMYTTCYRPMFTPFEDQPATTQQRYRDAAHSVLLLAIEWWS